MILIFYTEMMCFVNYNICIYSAIRLLYLKFLLAKPGEVTYDFDSLLLSFFTLNSTNRLQRTV